MAEGTSQATAAGGGEAPVVPPRILRSVLPGIGFGVLFAGGVVCVDAVVAVYSGSYLARSALLICAVFWMSTAAIAAVGLSGVLLPVMLLVKRGERAVILPWAVMATGCTAQFFVMREAIIDTDSLGGAVLLNPIFLCVWGGLVAVIVTLAAVRLGRGGWASYLVGASATLSCAGLSYFLGRAAGAFVLVIGPLALAAVGGIILAAVSSGRARAMWGITLAAVMFVALGVTARLAGRAPLAPIRKPYAPASADPASRPNVVIIVVDTLRADHTSLCGYEKATTPNLVALARDSRLFPYGVSVDSCTLPAHASILTGKYPRQHGARAHEAPVIESIERYPVSFSPLHPSQLTLATHLAGSGYATGAVVANYARLCRQFGFDQGFSYYFDLPRMFTFAAGGSPVLKCALNVADRILGRNGKLLQTYYSARFVTEKARDWVDEVKGRPFFLFLNYMDPHYPYSAVPPFDEVGGPDIPYSMELRQRPWQNLITRYIRTGQGFAPELRMQAVNQYDGELAYSDHWIGKLVEHLKTEGLYDNTLIVVTSDHGEAFGDHGFLDHTLTLYEEQVRVPILVKYPSGAHAGEVRRERVSVIDIFATVMETAGLAVAPDVPAQPLGTATHAIVAENYENALRTRYYGNMFKRNLTAIYAGDLKYTESTDGRNELYDLARDPTESHNLFSTDSPAAAQMRAKVLEWRTSTPSFDTGAFVKSPVSRQDQSFNASGFSPHD